jgi:cation:H+ antiporter
VLVRGLDVLGVRLGLREGLLGLLTALGADAPEIASAVLALRAGAPDVGIGVVLGSNIFNLAALLGLSALVAGHVRVRRVGLALNGGVAVLATLLAAALLGGSLSPTVTLLLLLVVFIPYVAVLALPPHQVDRLPMPRTVARFLAVATSEIGHEAKIDHTDASSRAELPVWPGRRSWRPILLILPAILAIIAASEGMVATAIALGSDWGVPSGLVGAVILAGLTSLPNAYAALRLAVQHRGSAVVSEACNSNTINLLAGICLPAIVLGPAPVSGATAVDLVWLLGMTGLSVALLAGRRGLTRPGGAAIIALYALFVVRYLHG